MKTSQELKDTVKEKFERDLPAKIEDVVTTIAHVLHRSFSASPIIIPVDRQDEEKRVDHPIYRAWYNRDGYDGLLDEFGLLDFIYSDIYSDPRTGGFSEKVYFLNERARDLYEGLKAEGFFEEEKN